MARVARKIDNFKTFKNKALNTCRIVGNTYNVSADEIDALAGYIITLLSKKNDVYLSPDEYEHFVESMANIIEKHEEIIKNLKR